LEALIRALGLEEIPPAEEIREYRNEVLAALERGEITPQEAVRRLKEFKG